MPLGLEWREETAFLQLTGPRTLGLHCQHHIIGPLLGLRSRALIVEEAPVCHVAGTICPGPFLFMGQRLLFLFFIIYFIFGCIGLRCCTGFLSLESREPSSLWCADFSLLWLLVAELGSEACGLGLWHVGSELWLLGSERRGQ